MNWLRSKTTPPSESAAETNRRERGRVQLDGVESNLGPVLDLSASGARVLSDRQQRGVVALEFQTFDKSLKLSAEIVWSRKVAHRQFLIGLRLLDVSDEDRRALGQIASSHRPREGC